jgi:hypothetical protein
VLKILACAAGDPKWVQPIMELGVVRDIVRLLHHQDARVFKPAVSVVLSLRASSSPERSFLHLQTLVNAGAVRGLCHLLEQQSQVLGDTDIPALGFLKSAMERQDLLQACIDGGAIEALKRAWRHRREQRQEAALSALQVALTRGSVEQLMTMACKGATNVLGLVLIDQSRRDRFESNLVHIMRLMNLPLVDEMLERTGLRLKDLLPGIASIPHTSVSTFRANLRATNDTPIEPYRRVLRQLVERMADRGDAEAFSVPSCENLEAQSVASEKRLARLRRDAWSRRRHLALARGAFRRGYRLWEQDEEQQEGREEGGGSERGRS